ncbi:MAG: DUF4037 domain-containing protein [Eubacteriales bacterium]|nr:DUF4037 domain-containing protein [Eubacteriales bacterium]
MKGLELSRAYYERFGADMIHEKFPEYEAFLAVGLIGSGSECLGYDDDISRDHDFEPGFCIFLPDESLVNSKTEFRLERAYAGLPSEFEGVRRLRVAPVGGSRHGVIRLSDFLRAKLGTTELPCTPDDWFRIPEYSLAELCGGQIFRDDLGELTAIRSSLATLPDTVRLKKLAGRLLLMAQSGQYNYGRCLARGETGAAQLAIGEFVDSTMAAVFLLERRYMPYYKWRFRALRELSSLGEELAGPLEFLLTTENTAPMCNTKSEIIEDIAGIIINRLKHDCLTSANCGDLEKHAYSVNDGISDADVRNSNILYAV